ncbi:MAG: hypothetical protein P8M34_13375 [Saprospiraceae bacterium]|nr:hypothetical protein [Saprospiraceae bacterium]|tara:strand:- start:88 stop:552 length:465 start_codon:yes stop_codon:yes gene_type:complete
MVIALPTKYLIPLVLAVILSSALIFQSCASSKKWKKHIEGPIIFGSMGGFVGSFDEYTINQDGNVHYRASLKGERIMVQKLEDDIKKSIFEKIKTDEIYVESIDEPGNMTFFIKFNYKSEPFHLQWGGQYDPSTRLLGYYNFLRSQIRSKDPVM